MSRSIVLWSLIMVYMLILLMCLLTFFFFFFFFFSVTLPVHCLCLLYVLFAMLIVVRT
jgi:hypothetical protein